MWQQGMIQWDGQYTWWRGVVSLAVVLTHAWNVRSLFSQTPWFLKKKTAKLRNHKNSSDSLIPCPTVYLWIRVSLTKLSPPPESNFWEMALPNHHFVNAFVVFYHLVDCSKQKANIHNSLCVCCGKGEFICIGLIILSANPNRTKFGTVRSLVTAAAASSSDQILYWWMIFFALADKGFVSVGQSTENRDCSWPIVKGGFCRHPCHCHFGSWKQQQYTLNSSDFMVILSSPALLSSSSSNYSGFWQ